MKSKKLYISLILVLIASLLPITSYANTTDVVGNTEEPITLLPVSYDLRDLGAFNLDTSLIAGDDIQYSIANSLKSHLLLQDDLSKTDLSTDDFNKYLTLVTDSYSNQNTEVEILSKDLVKLNPSYYIKGINYIKSKTDPMNNDYIKTSILDNGAITTTFTYDPTTVKSLYNKSTFGWFNPNDTIKSNSKTIHINIIGWDDNYPKDNFNQPATEDGAFICSTNIDFSSKWPVGTKSSEDIFYVSYYDAQFLQSNTSKYNAFVCTELNLDNIYDNTYRYDNIGFDTSYEVESNELWIASTYGRSKDNTESLKAISLYTLNDDMEYEVYFSDRETKIPSDKYLEKIHTGALSTAGYHTIVFPEPVSLRKASFTISIKLKSNSEDILLPLDSMDDINVNDKQSYGSFVKIESKSYKHLDKLLTKSQLCLRAYTDNIYSDKELLSPKKMKDDVDSLLTQLREQHSEVRILDFNKYQSQIIEQVYENIKEPMPLDDFYFEVNKILTMLRDYNTHLEPSSLSNNRVLDIPFVWVSDGMVVTQDTEYMEKGDEIVRVGGIYNTQLLYMLREYISAENNYWVMNMTPTILTREAYLKDLNLMLNNNYVQIDYKRDGEIYRVNHPLVKNPKYLKTYRLESQPTYTVDKKNDLGVFTIDYWFYEQQGEESVKLLQEFFQEVSNQGIGNICFDIRNARGHSYYLGQEILSYLNHGSLYRDGYVKYRRYEDITPKDDDLLFSGNVFVMTSNSTAYYSIQFASLLSDNGEAYTIGEPTGVSPAANPIYFRFDQLPNTGIKFRMSRALGTRAGNLSISEDTLYPNIEANRTIKDIIKNRDIQMETLKKYTSGELTLPALEQIEAVDKNKIYRLRKEIYLKNRYLNEREPIMLDSSNSREIKVWSVFYEDRYDNHYICLSLKPVLSEEAFNPSKFYLIDEHGNKVSTVNAKRGRTAFTNLVFTPESILEKGLNYTVHIEPGAFKDESGMWNSNYIKMNVMR